MVLELAGADDAGLEQVELTAAIHLAFDELELGDLSLGLAIGPGRGDRRTVLTVGFARPAEQIQASQDEAEARLGSPVRKNGVKRKQAWIASTSASISAPSPPAPRKPSAGSIS